MNIYRPSLACLFTLVLGILVFSVPSNAEVTFERTYHREWYEDGYSVHQTQDRGYIIAGRAFSSGGTYIDAWLIKTDSLGDTLWTRTFGGVGQDCGYSVDETQDGGYVLAGHTSSFGAGSTDVYLVRTDSVGNPLWEKTFGGLLWDYASSVQETRDGGFFIVGETMSFGSGAFDVYAIKTDSLGVTGWERTYGGSGFDHGYSAQQTLDGGYVLAGATSSFGVGGLDFYIIKVDSLGGRIWSRTYGGGSSESARSIKQTADGGFIVAGATGSFGEGEEDFYIVRTDSLGYGVWAKTYGGSSSDYAHCATQTLDGGYVIVGRTDSYAAMNSAVYIVKTDSVGDTLWTRVYGFRDSEGHSIEQTQDGGYIVAGYYYGIHPQLGDVYLIKTDGNGMTGIQEERPALDIEHPTVTLLQNRPNPFSHSTVISYSLSGGSSATLDIYDVAGRRIRTFAHRGRFTDSFSDPNQGFRSYSFHVVWDGTDDVGRRVPAGVYFCRLKVCPEPSEGTGEFVETRKMAVID